MNYKINKVGNLLLDGLDRYWYTLLMCRLIRNIYRLYNQRCFLNFFLIVYSHRDTSDIDRAKGPAIKMLNRLNENI